MDHGELMARLKTIDVMEGKPGDVLIFDNGHAVLDKGGLESTWIECIMPAKIIRRSTSSPSGYLVSGCDLVPHWVSFDAVITILECIR